MRHVHKSETVIQAVRVEITLIAEIERLVRRMNRQLIAQKKLPSVTRNSLLVQAIREFVARES